MRTLSLLALAALLGAAAPAAAAPLFASPPHFLTLGDRQRIVLFLNEPVQGALVARTGDATFEVAVPGSTVDSELAGTIFRGDDAPPQPRVQSLVIAANKRGGTTIRIETVRAVGSADTYTETDPPRLVIELATGAAPKPPATTKTVIARATSPVVPGDATRNGVTEPPVDAGRARVPAGADAQASVAARVLGAPAAAAVPAPIVVGMAVPKAATTGTANPGIATAKAAPAVRVVAAAATAHPQPTTQPTATSRRASASVRAAPLVPTSLADGGDDRMPCRLMRASGVVFCAPDPAAPPYVASPAASRLAAAIASATREDELPPALTGDDPAALYLAADRELVARAASRRLLAAVDLYRRALRRFPAFLDAPRARLNVAFAYRVVGFRREIAVAALATSRDPGAPLALAAAGDVALEDDDTAGAREWYDRAERAGGVGPCVAARGRAALAVKAADGAAVGREAGRFPELCPPALLGDPETQRLQARARIAAGDTAGALAILGRVRQALGPNGGPLVMEDTAAAAAAAGDETTARHLYEQVAAGLAGPAAARRAAIVLARMDAAHGNVAAGLARLNAIGTAETTAEGVTLARSAVTRALARGAAGDAVALIHEQAIDPAVLATPDQLRLAAAYRELGLPGESERLLERMQLTLGEAAPDAVWEERGRAALARDDAPRALAVADEWLRLRGRDDPGAALALRARALAALGEATAARTALAAAVGSLDAAVARTLRLEVATRLRGQDAAAARDILQEALAARDTASAPGADVAELLRGLADAAEAAGDDATAASALDRLVTDHANDPAAAGAGYRLARLRAGLEGGKGARAAYRGAPAKDALEKRVVAAAEAYEAIVTPFERPLPEPLEAHATGAPTGGAEPAAAAPGEMVPAARVPAPRRGAPAKTAPDPKGREGR